MSRPWQIGIIHDDDGRLAAPLIAALRALDGIDRRRQPALFAGRPRLFHAGAARAFARPACAMIEIRNDEISDETGQRKWADLLTGIFSDLEPEGGQKRSRNGAAAFC